MTEPTDTNQASEDELMRQLGFRYEPSEGGYYIHKFVKNPENPSSLNSVLLPEVAKQIQALIRTEKLKLLDELEAKAQEYVVIGEQLRGFPYFITVDNIKAERNKLEAEL